MLGFHVFVCKKLQHSYNNSCKMNTSRQIVKVIPNIYQTHPNNLLAIAYKLFVCLTILWDQVLPGYDHLQIFLATLELLLQKNMSFKIFHKCFSMFPSFYVISSSSYNSSGLVAACSCCYVQQLKLHHLVIALY